MSAKDVYVSICDIGTCRVCGERQDLRCGACFHCAGKVSGERKSANTHKMWETTNPRNCWHYSETGDA